MTLVRRLFQLGLLAILAGPEIVSVPDWLRATWLGCAWGGLLIAGMIACWARHRLSWCLYAATAAIIARRTLSQTLELEAAPSWLLVCMLIIGGWLIGKAVLACRYAHNHLQPHAVRWPQLSLWDLGLAATAVALLCTLVPRVEERFYLACRLAPALSGGMLLSLLAAQWAWRDDWTLLSMVAALAVIPLTLLMILPYQAITQSWQDHVLTIAAWLLVGPVGVIVAQATLVLAYLAVCRLNSPGAAGVALAERSSANVFAEAIDSQILSGSLAKTKLSS